ncbi:polysaccharide deacetylase, partial [Candidatus Magnetomorum sp. HK-1]
LKDVYDYVLSIECIPIFTSDYVAIAQGFLTGKVLKLKDGGWLFKGYQECSTVRLDNEKRYPDLTRSKGIIGFRRWENYLYISLGFSNESTLYLKNTEPKITPYLSQSSTKFTEYSLSKEQGRFITQSFGKGIYQFHNMLKNKTYALQVTDIKTGKAVLRQDVSSNDEGMLKIQFLVKGKIEVSFSKKE